MILRADLDFLKLLSVNSFLAYWLNKSRIKKRSTCGNSRADWVGKLKLLQRIIDEAMFLPSLMKICIDDHSLSKFISLVVQIYLAVLAIANAFRKLCLTAKEN